MMYRKYKRWIWETKRGTLVGLSATVLPAKIIGENCIVGAGEVVIDDVPPNTTVVGVPARQIRKEVER